jgi:hypothetical protein
MAIHYIESTGSNGKPNAVITIDNGDLQALKDVMEQYQFVDQQALLRYALVGLLRSEDNKLYIKNNSNIVAMNINETLIKKPPEETSQ